MASQWMQEADENAKKYAEAIRQQSQYLIDQQNKAKDSALNAIENQRMNAVNTLNASKNTVNQTAESSAKQANINRMLALKDNQGVMSRAGLSTQGIVGSQVNSINNSYGNNLNSILRDKANQLNNIDEQVNAANIQYDTNRLNASNEFDSNIANLRNQIDTQANSAYETEKNRYLQWKQQEYENEQAELARQEARRQWEEEMAYQRQQDAIANSQKWASINNTYNNPVFGEDNYQVDTAYYKGNYNPAVGKYGTFSNGYQPKGVIDDNGKDHGAISKSGDTITFPTQTLSGQKQTVTQNIWKASDGTKWYWDGRYNKYIQIK